MNESRILKALAVMVLLLCLAAVPALAETKNGPLVFSNYYDTALDTYDPVTGQRSHIYYGISPDVTPDGKTVVFSTQSYGEEIYSVPIGTRNAVPSPLTDTGQDNPFSTKQWPTVSPDGTTVYFQYTVRDQNNESNLIDDIYSVPIGGGDITRVTHDNYTHANLEITPDGENFVYGGGGQDLDFFVQPVSGGAATTLDSCESTAICGYPAVSADGTKVAFMKSGAGDYAVYTMPFSTTGGSTPTKVPGSEVSQPTFVNPGVDMTVDFSPDGKYIAYNALEYTKDPCPNGEAYCGKAETRWIPVEGGNYTSKQWGFLYAPVDVVWAPAAAAATDTTKPTTTAASSPQANSAGWNNSEVKVTLSATDNDGGSGVEKITYSASGAQSIAQTPASGSSVDVKLDQEGTTTLTYFATDKAGNVEVPKTLTVKIDETPPSVSSTNPSNNANGVAATANISATFSESGSGIDLGTFTNSTFQVVQLKPTGNMPVSLGKFSLHEDSEDSQTVTFDPESSLAKGAFRATLTTDITDKAGNALANAYTWQFATAGPSKK